MDDHDLPLVDRLQAAIGEVSTNRLLRARGGTQVTIPARARGSWIAELIGEQEAEFLIAALGPAPVKLTLPMANMRGPGARRRKARTMLAEGRSLAEVAHACDLHERTVSRVRAAMDKDGGASKQPELPFDI